MMLTQAAELRARASLRAGSSNSTIKGHYESIAGVSSQVAPPQVAFMQTDVYTSKL